MDRLPAEVKRWIALQDSLSPHDLTDLARVDKSWRDAAEHNLWRSLWLEGSGDGTERFANAWLQGLIACPKRVSYVRYFSVDLLCVELLEDRVPLPAVTAVVEATSSHLRWLSLVSLSDQINIPAVRLRLSDFMRHLSDFPFPRLSWIDMRVYDVEHLSALIRNSPRLEHISIGLGFHGTDELNPPLPQQLRSLSTSDWPEMSRLNELEFTSQCNGISLLSLLISKAPRLRQVTIDLSTFRIGDLPANWLKALHSASQPSSFLTMSFRSPKGLEDPVELFEKRYLDFSNVEVLHIADNQDPQQLNQPIAFRTGTLSLAALVKLHLNYDSLGPHIFEASEVLSTFQRNSALSIITVLRNGAFRMRTYSVATHILQHCIREWYHPLVPNDHFAVYDGRPLTARAMKGLYKEQQENLDWISDVDAGREMELSVKAWAYLEELGEESYMTNLDWFHYGRDQRVLD